MSAEEAAVSAARGARARPESSEDQAVLVATPAADGDAPHTPEDPPLLFSSTVTRGAFHQCGSGRRVKLYVLDGQAWVDRGTGYCAGVYDESADVALLVVRSEEFCESLGDVADASVRASEGAHDGDAPHTYMLVVRADLHSDEILLNSPVAKDDVYRRQHDTLVVWTEPSCVDLALSFQEMEGCNEVWDFLTEVQRHFMASSASVDVPTLTAAGDTDVPAQGDSSRSLDTTSLDDYDDSAYAPLFRLPPPDAANLGAVEREIRETVSQGVGARERVVEWLLKEDYIRALVPVFREAEENETLDVLHALYRVMKAIVTTNDNLVVEHILQEDLFPSVIGMLEYDPSFPTLKASYRQYLTEETHFRQVIEFDDAAIVGKIRETYRLIYLKGVVLARLMDDATQSMLSSLLFFYQSDIVTYCVNSERLLSQLLALFDGEDTEVQLSRRAEAVLFVQELCSMARQIQMPGRVNLFHTLVEWGLLRVVAYALARTDTNVRNAGADILLAAIEYDASSVRAYILQDGGAPPAWAPGAGDDGAGPRVAARSLLRMLIDLLHTADAGLQGQMAEAIRVLLDVSTDAQHAESDRFLVWVYETDMEALFAPLQALPPLETLAHDAVLPPLVPQRLALYMHLCELLCFVIAQHSFRSQYYVLTSDICRHVGALLHVRDKHMRLAALRVFGACLASNNQFTHRHLVKLDVPAAILELLMREAPRDNLVSSACLGLLDQIRRENMKPLLLYLVEHTAEQLDALATDGVAGPCIEALRMQCERSMLGEGGEPQGAAGGSGAAVGSDRGADAAQDGSAASPRADEEEETYFASEETGSADPPSLVPYGDDEDDDLATESPALAMFDQRRRKDTVDDDDDDEDAFARLAKRKDVPAAAATPPPKRMLRFALGSVGKACAQGDEGKR
ncbi:Platinum sensitivity protein [Malassezia sp. CBS 17886]|nr:Platinum sensitivity protein [Malassezia sp. CBS 17886]